MPRHKENNPADAHAGKRQRTATGAGRQPLSAAAPPPPPLPLEEEPMVFAGREDVEALLNEKMKGKNKMDYKVTDTSPTFLFSVLRSHFHLCGCCPG
jgi:kinesin family protein C1